MSYLAPKTVQTYLEKIKLKAPGTVKNIKASLTKLDNFIQEKGGTTLDTYIQKLKNIQPEHQLEKLFDDLQIFINGLVEQGISRASARNHIYNAKGFIRYCGIKIHKEDIKDNLDFGRIAQQEREGITKDQLKKIIENAKPGRKALYLALSSSGMRPQEAIQLRKRDFDTTKSRIMIRIPAKYTKTKKSRITFISKEAESYVLPILKRLGPDDLVFGTNQNPMRAKLNEEQSFNILRDKLGFTERYDSRTHKVTLGGSLRSWFVTKANRVDYGFGHALAGHDQYMKRYDRLSEDEKLELYIKTEPSLSAFDENQTDQEYKDRLEKLQKRVDFGENISKFLLQLIAKGKVKETDEFVGFPEEFISKLKEEECLIPAEFMQFIPEYYQKKTHTPTNNNKKLVEEET